MTMRDPRSSFYDGGGPNPETGTESVAGYLDHQGVDLGNGLGAMLVIAATRTPGTINASTTSVQAFAKNLQRCAATIRNNDFVNMYVGYAAAAVVGTDPKLTIKPGAQLNVPPQYVTGQVNVIWDTGGTVAADTIVTIG